MKNFTSIKDEINKIVQPILQKNNLTVYQIKNYFDFESDILQILVEDIAHPNKALDFDAIIACNEEISLALDDFLGLTEPYMLELASAGIEKQIFDQIGLMQAIKSYVHIKLNRQVNQSNVIEGTLLSFDDEKQTFKITYFLKGQIKKVDFTWAEVEFARYAVKF